MSISSQRQTHDRDDKENHGRERELKTCIVMFTFEGIKMWNILYVEVEIDLTCVERSNSGN